MTAMPVTSGNAVWRPGDPEGSRRFARLGALPLERGGALPEVTVAYETWGTLSPAADNAVLVEHALTGDSHVVGDSGPGHPSPGWWPGLIGPGAPLDTDRFFVVASNVLGGCQGTTGPSSTAPDGRPWGSRFPFVTIRDQVAVEAALADVLGVRRWHTVLGGSMGGMRVLEWAAGHPGRVERALVLASTRVRHRRPGGVVPAAAARHPGRPRLPRRRLLRHRGRARDRDGDRAPDRSHHLPARG